MPTDLPPAYGGEILYVHLDDGTTEHERIDPVDARRFLGGNGFAARLVHEHVSADAGDALAARPAGGR